MQPRRWVLSHAYALLVWQVTTLVSLPIVPAHAQPTAPANGIVGGLIAVVGVDAQSGVPTFRWHESLEDAAAIARHTSRPMLIEFWADWCAACTIMDAQVYPDEQVARAMSRLLPVRIDADRETALVRKYRVEGLPTLVYTDSYGNELFRFTGLLSAGDMAQLLTQLPTDVERINRFGRIVAERGGDFTALADLGHELRATRLYRSSNEYHARALRSRGARSLPARRGGIIVEMGANHLSLKEFAEAADVFEKYLREFRGGPLEAEAMLGLSRAWLGQNRKDKAKPVLENLLRQHTGGAARDEAARLLSSL